ncbi:hypothetical protein NAS141_16884 [Sulfitobacter sp. NAS-14.1]|nr:hypothetical protein NAS141_16884 [Sulfitobacter sp. NAS-14.1]
MNELKKKYEDFPNAFANFASRHFAAPFSRL